MPWKCYSCETKNPNSRDECKNCGGNVAAPRSFYIHWVFGGGIFFLVTYLVGIFVGGTLVEVAVAPADAEVFAIAKAKGATASSILELKPEELKAARKAVVAKGKAAMSPLVRNLLLWFLPVILFVVCGAIVGFVSDGKTILEAGFGSVIGQVVGFLLLTYLFNAGGSWMAVIVGIVPGFGLAMLGAWAGEILQDRRERAV